MFKFLRSIFSKGESIPKSTSEHLVLDSSKVSDMCFGNFGVRPVLADASYACPTKKWVGKFFVWYRWCCARVGVVWKGCYDCDDFARLAAAFAQISHYLSDCEDKPQGLAFGEFWYDSELGPHAVNIILIEDSEAIWYEPQTGKELNLTDEEKESCCHIRF